MNRRTFIAGVGSAAAWPMVAQAQQAAVPVVGLLNSTTFEALRDEYDVFRGGLAEFGYVEGRNVAFEYRAAENQYDRLPALADDLVRRRVAVIFSASNTPPALAAKGATRVIPIVFTVGTRTRP
jgi:putative ABC transport system substrate-binding protein